MKAWGLGGALHKNGRMAADAAIWPVARIKNISLLAGRQNPLGFCKWLKRLQVGISNKSGNDLQANPCIAVLPAID